MSLKDLTIGDFDKGVINAVIEIPKGTKNKYEYDEKLDLLKLDRVVQTSVVYPVNYGFVPGTRAEDGDHLDILVLSQESLFPGCVASVRPIGILKMTDTGTKDWKIVSVIQVEAQTKIYQDIGDVNEEFRNEIAHFFEVYKQLEGKKVTVEGWGSKEEALTEIRGTIAG